MSALSLAPQQLTACLFPLSPKIDTCAYNCWHSDLLMCGELVRQGGTSYQGHRCHAGWVKTDMTNNSGLIDASTSAAGLISVLESGKPLSCHWYDYKHEEIPW